MATNSRLWALLTIFFYAASLAFLYHYGLARSIGIHDYVSDECWYVSSAINVARKVLGLHIVPKVNSSFAVYTVFYAENCSLNDVLALLERFLGLPVALAKSDYSKVRAVAVYVPLNLAGKMEMLQGECIVDVAPGLMPDESNINTYLNTEHPPLVKYVLALALWAAGFNLALLRAISFAVAAVGLAAVYVVVYFSLKKWGFAAIPTLVIPLTVTVFDKSVQSMSAVAMLDVYVASLDTVAMALLLYGRLRASSIVVGAAGAAKYTGLFPLPAIALCEYARSRSVARAAAAVTLAVLIVALSWTPFVVRYGFKWTFEQIAGAVSWHTTSRPPGGPPSTSPLGLVLGYPGFTLYYVDGTPYLVAASNPGVCVSAMVVAVLALILACTGLCTGLRDRDEACRICFSMFFLPSTFLGYILVWVAGNHTLYNFYSVQLSLESAAVLALYPVLLDYWRFAKLRLIASCILEGQRWIYAAASLAGVMASYMAATGLRLGGGVGNPLYDLVRVDGKLSLLGFASLAGTVYTFSALRIPVKSYGLRFILGTASWLAAGLSSLYAIASSLAPLAAVAASLGSIGLLDGVLLGIILPPVAAWLLACSRRIREAALVLAGFAAALTATAILMYSAGYSLPTLRLILAYSVILAGSLFTRVSLPTSTAMAVVVEPSLLPLLMITNHYYSWPRGGRLSAAYESVGVIVTVLLLAASKHVILLPAKPETIVRVAALLALLVSLVESSKRKMVAAGEGRV